MCFVAGNICRRQLPENRAQHGESQQSYSMRYNLKSMTAVLCPDCGWTGDESDQIDIEGEDTPQCPVCSEDVQFVD